MTKSAEQKKKKKRKQPTVELAIFNDGVKTFTTEEIEHVKSFQNFRAPDSRCTTPQSKIVLKDGRQLRTLHSVESVKKLMKAAGGRLRSSRTS